MNSNVAPPANAPARIIHSYSSLSYFAGCPHRYSEVKLQKNFRDAPFKASTDGTDIHEIFERHIRDGVPLPEFAKKFETTMEAIKEQPGQKFCELKMGIDINGAPCDFWNPAAAIRGSADLLILEGSHAIIIDYKSGRVKHDTDQLALMALMALKKYPHIETVSGVLIFVAHEETVTARFTAEDTIPLWAAWVGKMSRVTKAIRENDFPANPSGLCRNYCPVTSCIYNGEHATIQR
jgi:hypothetical protein